MTNEDKYEGFNFRMTMPSCSSKPKTAIEIEIDEGMVFWMGVRYKMYIHYDRNMLFIRKAGKIRAFQKFMNEHEKNDNEAIYNSLRMELSKDELDSTVIKYLLNKMPHND